ncbi:MAG: hypothetical protein QM638_14575 [Nocardioides sp.]|uniref:hypothetical protein n=1 Tax=Nocardioides sp. TaxID=35761 RepID=UPI0039E2CA4B
MTDLPPSTDRPTGRVAAARTAGEVPAGRTGEKYEDMLQLADSFDLVGRELRDRAKLGAAILHDPEVAESAELAPRTWAVAEEEILAATSGKHGLLDRGVELDADALMVRATVLTYRWIDELASAAYHSLGEIAGRAIGYLAPEVELGGSLVSAGLIETDALDREGVTAYLGELAAEHPELMDHIVGGGGLAESLQLRSLLTASAPRGEDAAVAAAGARRAVGMAPFPADVGSALRDVAGDVVGESQPDAADQGEDRSADATGGVPSSLEELIATLESVESGVSVRPATAGRYIAYLPGPYAGRQRLRLVSGDLSGYAAEATAAIEAAVEPGAHLMLVGAAAGGATAASLAAAPSAGYDIDQVVTVGAPAAAAPRIPARTRVLSLEDRADPVALLGGLINADAGHRLTVVYDGTEAADETGYTLGGRAADRASHPELRAELDRLRELGYLG